jgi:ligand-binding sensor domain-containing protein
MKFIVWCFLLVWPLAGRAATLFSRDMWLSENHVPVGINAMVQDAKGLIWLGTDAGLFRFNGRTFTAVADTVKAPVTALYEHEGMLWIGYRNGMLASIGRDGAWSRYSPLKNNAAISGVYADAWNTLLILTTEGNGVIVLYQGHTLPLSSAEGLSDDFVYGISFVGRDRQLLAGTDRGINRVRPAGKQLQVEQLNTKNGLPDNIVRVVKGLPGSNRVWAGMQEGGVALLEDTGRRQLVVRNCRKQWPWGQVNDLLPFSDTTAWAVTEKGYLLYLHLEGDSFRVRPEYLEGRQLRKLLSDPAGNIWCATQQGLTGIVTPHIRTIRMDHHYELAALSAMCCDTAGDIWYAIGPHIYCYEHAAARTSLRQTLPNPATALYADTRGGIWIGTLGSGIKHCDYKGRPLPMPAVLSLDSAHILDISGNEQELWVSGLNGVEQFSISRETGVPVWLRHHDRKHGLASDYIYQIHPVPQDKVWMATDGGGAGYYSNGRYHTVNIPGFNSEVAYSVTSAGRQVWINTLQDGLFCLEDSSRKQFSRGHGLQDLNITAIEGAADGRVVVVHQRGIGEWYPSARLFRHYNRRLGMDLDSTSSQLNCIASDRQGNIYVPCAGGFVCLDHRPVYRRLRPGIYLSGFRLFFKPLLPFRDELAWDENHLSFFYEGINYTNPERLHYRYRLEGYSEEWVLTGDESVTFPRLPPGTYHFRVQASMTADFAGVSEAGCHFIIKAPLWKRYWFILAVLLAAALLVYYYVRVRERNLRRLSRLQKEKMTFEYEHLKSQVNPHFLFNSLNTLVQIIDEDKEQATEYTIRLSDLYRNMLLFRDRELISLAEEWSLLEQYLYIQHNRFGRALQIDRHIPEHVLAGKRIIPMALQLLVENAIKHNVVSKDMPLVITITADEQYITVSNNLQPKMSHEKGAGLGIANLKNRYALLLAAPLAYGMYENNFVVKLPLL